MRAITYDKYGSSDVLELRDIDKPIVADDDVLVQIRATSVNTADWVWMAGIPYVARLAAGVPGPKVPVLGKDFAGRVEAVGKNITRVRPGDDVFGESRRMGAFAEYLCVSEDELAHKPANVTFEQAAATPLAGLTALQGLRDHGKVHAGQTVLINGATGAVGTFAVQIAKCLGAEVTGVCSPHNVEMVRSLGADEVVDYTRMDITRGPKRFDVIFDSVGNHSLSAYRRILTPEGVYVSSAGQVREHRWVGPIMHLLRMVLFSPFVRQRMTTFTAAPSISDLETLGELLAAERIVPVLDRVYALNELPDAMRYLQTGHARGKVVIRVE